MNGVQQQPDLLQGGFISDPAVSEESISGKINSINNIQFDFQSLEFATTGQDVLDFDFDSFLHQDGEGADNFNFDTNFLDSGEIGTE